MHPDSWEPLTPEEMPHAEAIGRIRQMEANMSGGGRYIGKTESTPSWCPFLRPEVELKREAEELNRITVEATQQPKPRTPLFRGKRKEATRCGLKVIERIT